MSTSHRLLRLLSLLQTPRDWTGAELASRLEVSPRTIRNDIERLRTLGYPVHATRGAVGGYRLEAGTSMPPLLLEDDEAVAVAIGVWAANPGAGGGRDRSSDRTRRRGCRSRGVVTTRAGEARAGPPAPTPAPGEHAPGRDRPRRARPLRPGCQPGALTDLARAARERFTLRFDYSDRRETASQRRVE